ncbi:ABC transporter, ATP-binding protein [Citrifermentans bremense]|uniref:ABC transporter, ATP-binding protein n=1 Tax=Citrifermentans bremense TaxID=60035 RepID=A0A6S6MB85_9BACT|nr:ABC transporter ATP-binding protein [Citrifermentans bremense]BCG48735.1 ABC transporter, ATP-binding protein [Citrifermentans bremense]
MISVQNVMKVFNGGRPNELCALREVSLEMGLDQATALVGPSGSGKTTLLSLIGCMARPTSGRIFVKEEEITSLPERFLTRIRRSTFGFVFQRHNLINGISVLENVMAPAYPEGEPFCLLRQRALDILERLDLKRRAEAKVEWLSGGEAQRVAIARAMINSPAVIIADEPTAHLDTKLSCDFMALMKEVKEAGTAVILASHDPVVYGCDFIDRVVEMRDGRIVTGSMDT